MYIANDSRNISAWFVFACRRKCESSTPNNKTSDNDLFCDEILKNARKRAQKYRVSIKSLYNLKKLLKNEMMKYRNEVCFMLINIS